MFVFGMTQNIVSRNNQNSIVYGHCAFTRQPMFVRSMQTIFGCRNAAALDNSLAQLFYEWVFDCSALHCQTAAHTPRTKYVCNVNADIPGD